jgi:hypothetical protein
MSSILVFWCLVLDLRLDFSCLLCLPMVSCLV